MTRVVGGSILSFIAWLSLVSCGCQQQETKQEAEKSQPKVSSQPSENSPEEGPTEEESPNEEPTEEGSQSPAQADGQAPDPLTSPFTPSQAAEATKRWASHLGVRAKQTNTVGMKLTLIPPGKFIMGAERKQPTFKPHPVSLTKPFYMGLTEVTQGQWKAVMKTEPWKGQHGIKEGANCPASVSWQDAVEFCKRLSKQEGATYRLPTEAEWEFACRAGTSTAYYFGDDPAEIFDHAWHDESRRFTQEFSTQAVGLKQANAFGLHDTLGNVWESCADWYRDHFSSEAVTDPKGPATGLLGSRVCRGGCWYSSADDCRSDSRRGFPPEKRNNCLGFRVAADSLGK